MSGTLPAHPPECLEPASASLELLVEARPRDLGGFVVRRVLPSAQRRLVGPFIFFDQMGPVELAAGTGFDVRPHPHIALATVTYLFEGEIDHRDSLGSVQTIRPGDVNWMVAGRGIVHSERSGPEARLRPQRIHGIQCWVALPTEQESIEPRFEHHPRASIPALSFSGVALDVIAGSAYGATSPVAVLSPTLYVHARLAAGAQLTIPPEHEERALYVVEGSCRCDGRSFGPGSLLVLRRELTVQIDAPEAARIMLLGGEKLQGERHLWWNFVASDQERIEQAKADWREGRFPTIPGDDSEFIPLPAG